jgi:RNA polymerase sigma-70 factor (ECF subfamily)
LHAKVFNEEYIVQQRIGIPETMEDNDGHNPGGLDVPATVARAQSGDDAAFELLIEHFQGIAYSIAYRTLQNEGAAGDAVQDSLLKAYRALHQFQGGSFKSWLLRIVANTCYDVMRTAQWRNTESLDEAQEGDEHSSALIDRALIDRGESPQEAIERAELNDWIEAGIRTLPPDQRMALTLCDVHGYSYDEIAEITGQPMGTVKSRINRARLRLRDFLLRRPELLPASFRP